jgi:hypothetical protein
MADTQILCRRTPIEGGVPPVSDRELINTIRFLHSVGLRVMLKPQALIESVHIAENELKDRHWDEAHRNRWFDSYIAFITHYAQIAQDNRVDLFVVGNEQEDNTRHDQEWRRVIQEVRAVYDGPLTYAANAWSFEASRIEFWDALDYIGTNAYQFSFVDKREARVDDLIRAWQPYLQRLEEMSTQFGKPVLITEFGALAMEGFHTGITNPPNWSPQPYDGQEQADFYTAAFEALKDKPWLKGIVLWDVYTNPLQGGPLDISYTFVGKPAEDVVRRYFGGAPIVPTPAPEYAEDPENSMWIYQDDLVNTWYLWEDPAAEVPPDFAHPEGHESSTSIRVSLSKSHGLLLNYGTPDIDLSPYKWLQFYVRVGQRRPASLLVVFENWDETGANSGSRMALVEAPAYLEGGEFVPGTWQRVRIPIADLGFTDQVVPGFAVDILSCAWPCFADYGADDIYIDDLQLVAGR